MATYKATPTKMIGVQTQQRPSVASMAGTMPNVAQQGQMLGNYTPPQTQSVFNGNTYGTWGNTPTAAPKPTTTTPTAAKPATTAVPTGGFLQWNANVPQYQPMNQGTQVTTGPGQNLQIPKDWMAGLGKWDTWTDPKAQGAINAWSNTAIPYAQLQQNSYQYGQDYNEAQRRWNNEFGWQQQGDQFNMGLAAQQQQMAEWVAQQQQGNWGKQYALDTELGRGNLAAQSAYWTGQNTNQAQANANTAAYQTGLLANTAQENKNTAAYQTGQLALGNRNAAGTEWLNQQNVAIQKAANQVDQQYKQGLITNAQRQQALAELTQKQNDAFRYSELAQQAQLAQQANASNQQIARWNAFGRAQQPNSRFIRSW